MLPLQVVQAAALLALQYSAGHCASRPRFKIIFVSNKDKLWSGVRQGPQADKAGNIAPGPSVRSRNWSEVSRFVSGITLVPQTLTAGDSSLSCGH